MEILKRLERFFHGIPVEPPPPNIERISTVAGTKRTVGGNNTWGHRPGGTAWASKVNNIGWK